MVLKFISRSLGKFLISISLSIFILSFLVISLVNNTDTLKDSFDSETILNLMLENEEGLTIEEIKTVCEKSPNQEGCDMITDPSKLLDEQFDPLIEQINSYKPLVLSSRVASIIVFLVGIVLIYLGTLNIFQTGYRVSITTFISSAFYALFYKLITTSLPTLAENIPMDQNVPQELLNLAVNAITSWIKLPVEETFSLCLVIALISLISSVAFFFLKSRK
jgi:hypothetical protein